MLTLNEKNFICSAFHYNAENPAKNQKARAYNDLRICYVEKGDALWQIDDRKYKVSEGDIIFLSNRQKRYFLNFNENGFKIQVIMLKRQAFSNTAHLSFFLNCIKEKKSIIRDIELLEILKSAVKEFTQKKLNYYELISAKFTEFFILAERKLCFNSAALINMDKNMIKILDYIDSNITGNISLAKISKWANLTESSFSRRFSKCNGVSFKRYVMARKVEHAVFLLDTTDMKVIDIAFECGFSSISGFYDAFKKITGTTPNKISTII